MQYILSYEKDYSSSSKTVPGSRKNNNVYKTGSEYIRQSITVLNF